MRVITFSRSFPIKHPRKGEETFFVEKIWKGLKTDNLRDGEYSIWTKHPRQMKDGHWQVPHLWRDQMNDKTFKPKFHTIRAGNRWKVGDFFSPRIWGDDINPKSGRSGPYQSKQIVFAPPIEIKKIWEIKIFKNGVINLKMGNSTFMCAIDSDGGKRLAENDGLNPDDFWNWFLVQSKKTKKRILFSGQVICWNEKIEY